MNRHFLFDLLKFFGISMIMFYHTMSYLGTTPESALPVDISVFFMRLVNYGGILALIPCFSLTFVSGSSFYFMIISRLENNKVKINKSNLLFILKRAIWLLAMGWVINLSSGDSSDYYQWDILQFIAVVSLVSFFIMTKLSPDRFFLMSVLSFIIYIFTRDVAIEINDITGNFNSLLIRSAIGSSSGQSYYAFFPWSIFFFIGISVGHMYFINKEKLLKIMKVVIIMTSPFYILGFNYWTVDRNNIWGVNLFLPTPFQSITILFSILSLFTFVLIIEDEIKKKKRLVGIINIFSKNILYVFLAHSLFVYWIINFIKDYFQSDSLLILMIILQYIFSFFVAYAISYIKKKRDNV